MTINNKLIISKNLEVEKFIYGITYEIWENRQIDHINDYYSKDVIVRSPTKTTYKCIDVINSTKNSLTQFPDRQLIGEDVIWSGNLHEGILSSHRILSTASHLGDGFYGKASGKKVTYRVIADCFIIDNKIIEEWIVRDETSILNQLGYNVKNFVQIKINNKSFDLNSLKYTKNSFNFKRYVKNHANDFTKTYKNNLHDLINKNFSCIHKYYERSAKTIWTGGKVYYSYNQIEKIWSKFLNCFNQLELVIHYFSGLVEPHLYPRVSIRWTISGRHSNEGIYGIPSFKQIEIPVLAHIEFGKYGIRREYIIFDEISIWKQILI